MTAGLQPIVPCYWQWKLPLRYPIWRFCQLAIHLHNGCPRSPSPSIPLLRKGTPTCSRSATSLTIVRLTTSFFDKKTVWKWPCFRQLLQVTSYQDTIPVCAAVDRTKCIFARTLVECRLPSPQNQRQLNGKLDCRQDCLEWGPYSAFLPQSDDSFVPPVRVKSAFAWRQSDSVSARTPPTIRSRKRPFFREPYSQLSASLHKSWTIASTDSPSN